MSKDKFTGHVPARVEGAQPVHVRTYPLITKLCQAVAPAGVDHGTIAKGFYAAFTITPKLLECDDSSIIRSAYACAVLGFVPNTSGEAYVLPYRNNRRGITEAQFILGYRGMVTLAGRAGVTVSAHVVARGDEFVYEEGLVTVLRHVPKRYSPPAVDLVAAYAVATMPDKQRVCVVLRREDVEERRDAGYGKGGNAGPWKDHTAEMWRKTAVRQVWKMIPQTAHLERAAIADRVERGQPLTIEADELVSRGLPEVGPALRAAREPGEDDESGGES